MLLSKHFGQLGFNEFRCGSFGVYYFRLTLHPPSSPLGLLQRLPLSACSPCGPVQRLPCQLAVPAALFRASPVSSKSLQLCSLFPFSTCWSQMNWLPSSRIPCLLESAEELSVKSSVPLLPFSGSDFCPGVIFLSCLVMSVFLGLWSTFKVF